MAKWLQRLEEWAGVGPGGQGRIKTFRLLVLLGLIGLALLLGASLLEVKPVAPGDIERNVPLEDRDVPGGEERETFLRSGADGGDNPFAPLERELENEIKDILEKMVGVGTVDVLVTIDSTEEIVVQKNESMSQRLTNESDRNGATRHITETTRDGQVVLYETSGAQSPIVVKRIKPHVRGVLIVARGAENGTVHRLIAEAVSRGLDVPLHRVSVVPRKQ